MSPEQLVVDPLYLPRDEHLRLLEVDVLPGQPEQLPPTQPEREQQDVPAYIGSPSARADVRNRRASSTVHTGIFFDRGMGTRTSERGNVAEDELFAHCLGQRTA